MKFIKFGTLILKENEAEEESKKLFKPNIRNFSKKVKLLSPSQN